MKIEKMIRFFMQMSIFLLIAAACTSKTDLSGELKGFNSQGVMDSCQSQMGSGEVMCTQEFTDQDQFAIDCRNSGGLALQCDCHHYLCSKKLSN